MPSNKHFIQFLNKLGLTIMELSRLMDMSYHILRARTEDLEFTLPQLIKFSQVTSIPLGELALKIWGDESVKNINTPFAITRDIAFEKLTKDDDFVRIILECNFVGGGQKNRSASQAEINILKRHFEKLRKQI